ncbi:sugar ABC transporter ATP-binding protein [Mesorhizobium sp. WSM4976]|uniref:sugar ABC transporter ATP-binding protein n=1 Tax=Mesorhizobium sp. WSM4976 TaxID=3038549 RepID=UPI002416FEE0|nr:sugar ABC transporter ATP-binding protein [Mesorhizobium sp. WSM4976]MDG4898390.1 sugar ABC transporter ATP-binding protein [Mesorhizobium sp. WSM4976]
MDRPEIALSDVPALLELQNVTKRFPGVVALKDMNFSLLRGEVHVLFGENGAGKSTLVNVIAGTYRSDEGSMRFKGEAVRFESPADARAAGINAVFQEFSLVPTLTVAQNIFLGREVRSGRRLDNREMDRRAAAILADLGFPLDPTARVDRLPRSSQQMLEIAKALQGDPRILILDEPTASLTERESEVLFTLIRRLTSEGVGIIYITHRMQEIKVVADRITVMRDGSLVATLDDIADVDEDRLVSLMTGREATALYPQIACRPGDEVLALRGVSIARAGVSAIDINVRAGEVVGVAGLVGSGKAEIAEACFGLHALTSGHIEVCGQTVDPMSPSEMLRRGMYFLPSDRRREGLVLPRSLRENISIASLSEPELSRFGAVLRWRERSKVEELIARLQVRPAAPDRPIAFFSGGNQQKALFARGLLRAPRVLVLNEPTTGVDVGARSDVYNLIKEVCERGAGVLVVSSDLPEILHLCHRAYVVHRGKVQAELCGPELTEEAVLANFFDA